MSKTSQWQSQPYLDALRPAPGNAVTGAILTSYSADLASIVAALLALVARDNDDGSGGKAELAEAVEQLRGKVRILIQRGRLARPKRIPPIAGILDQFIHEIDFDERERSWHPKVSLVQLANGSPEPEWRLWLGSRNLTAALNRDFGLLLTSASDPKSANATAVPGTGDLAGRLAAYARLDVFRPSKIRTAVDAIRWTQPDRLVVERVTLTTGMGTDKGPQPPDHVDEVIAISPFLDGGIVKNIGAWGGARTRRSLLSTQLALTKLANQVSKPLAGFKDNLFVLRVRCHVAVPFGSTDDDDRKKSGAAGDQAPRSDELRNAFNSPFWPHVLATTSVGQEGLDFHTWCRRILHWDLCSSPLELEQREGRIQRFGGLAVRTTLRRLAESDVWQSGAIDKHTSLWDRIGVLADAKYRDASGLSPWWVLDGATVSRFVFDLPQSRDQEKFNLLKEQRLIYRLALGQPNQEDLVDFLAKGGPGLTRILQPLALNLSAFARSESESPTEL